MDTSECLTAFASLVSAGAAIYAVWQVKNLAEFQHAAKRPCVVFSDTAKFKATKNTNPSIQLFVKNRGTYPAEDIVVDFVIVYGMHTANPKIVPVKGENKVDIYSGSASPVVVGLDSSELSFVRVSARYKSKYTKETYCEDFYYYEIEDVNASSNLFAHQTIDQIEKFNLTLSQDKASGK